MELYMQLQIKKDNNVDLVESDVVAPVQLIANSMWSNIAIDINGQPVSDLTNMYSNYKGYMETVMSFGRDAIQGHLKSALFFDDGDDINSTTSEGFKARQKLAAKSNIFETRLRPASDLISIRKPLPPDVEITMRFTRSPDKFCLMTDDASKNNNYYIHIVKSELHIKYKTLRPNLHSNIIGKWHGNQQYYPMTKTSCKTYIFGSGLVNLQVYNLFTGTLPKQFFPVLFDADNFNGSLETNPFKASHHDINYFCIRHNGVQVPSSAYSIDFDKDHYVRLYRDFCSNIGQNNNDTGTLITPETYKNNYCFLSVNLNPDACTSEHTHIDEVGTIDLEIKLKKPTTKSVILFVLAYCDGFLALDEWRNPTTSFGIAT